MVADEDGADESSNSGMGRASDRRQVRTYNQKGKSAADPLQIEIEVVIGIFWVVKREDETVGKQVPNPHIQGRIETWRDG
jgi:hypothetical protein